MRDVSQESLLAFVVLLCSLTYLELEFGDWMLTSGDSVVWQRAHFVSSVSPFLVLVWGILLMCL